MMAGNFLHDRKRNIILLLILCFSSGLSFSQKKLSGNLNQPSSHVNAMGAGTVTVDDISGFAANDTILLIQMQGVRIYGDHPLYGVLWNKFGVPGQHEFMKILSVNVPSKQITFWNNIKNTYDLFGNIQIVRVPYYNSATVTGTLYCNPWNPATKSGGVLAMIIGRTIKLQADIDLTGKGFTGGVSSTGSGICQKTNSIYQNDFYDASDLNSGFKGEGVANYVYYAFVDSIPVSPGYLKGQGPNFNGGGGGNGKYSGGGGGANYGLGGLGGQEDPFCSPNYFGGSGGVITDDPALPNSVFMGGGGGSSTSDVSGTSGSGGNGGGIVIIVTDTIIGKGGNIIANGAKGGDAIGLAGAGGGGAGGSIALSTNSYGSDPIKFYVKGGNGGNSDAATGGEGGGAGGGLVWVSSALTSNAISIPTEGIRGTPGVPSNNPASPGNNKTGFKAVLNGFLYNSIRSSVTGDLVDSICSNVVAPKITGTIPFGGTPGYTTEWQKSVTSESAGFSVIAGVTSNDYDPGLLPQTTWFKRIITDHSAPVIVDESKPVKIIVHAAITGNLVGSDQIICWNQDPAILIPLNSGPSNGSYMSDGLTHYYLYKWHQNTADAGWDSSPVATANASLASYDPPSLTSTKYYKRFVTSGRCIDYGPTVTITVLDTIKSNKILNSSPDICIGSNFVNLTATTAPAMTGGDNSYRFKWESNINGLGWAVAPGVSNGSGYNPIELPQRVPSNQYLYRRIVYSGAADVCASISNSVLLKDFPVITNNTISPLSAICSGSKPANIVGSLSPTLSGGNTNYVYSWEDSTKYQSWTLITGATLSDFSTPALIDTTSYRRIVDAVCTNVSKSIRVVVHKPILNNDITLLTGGVAQTLCNNQTPVSFHGTLPTGGTNLPGDYAYMWKFSTDNSVFTAVPSGGTGVNYIPPALTLTTYYKREVTSGKCTVISDPLTITVLPDITNNSISGNPKVCYSLIPGIITGAALSGGSGSYKYLWEQSTDGGINWSPALSANSLSDYQPPALSLPTKYRRTVSSGLNDCCKSVSNNFDISIDPLPVSQINAGPDTIIYSVEKLYHMKAINPALAGTGETGTWKPLDGGTVTIDDTSKFNTVVRNLSEGKNSFLWTVHRGPCNLKDSVDIELLKDFIPQGFSPNDDAWNNTFEIAGLSPDDQSIDVRIVNGAGTEVYKFSGGGETLREWKGWDGKNLSGRDLPEGTYYYMIKITGKSGQIFKRSGFIILKRY